MESVARKVGTFVLKRQMTASAETRQAGHESGDRTAHLFTSAVRNGCHSGVNPFLNMMLENCYKKKSVRACVFLQDTADKRDY